MQKTPPSIREKELLISSMEKPIVPPIPAVSTTKPSSTTITDPPKNEWQTVPSNKRIRSPELAATSKLRKTSIKDYMTTTSNRFQTLDLPITDQQQTVEPVPKPPPIFVPNVTKIEQLTNIVKSAVGENNYSYKIIGNNQVKIQPASDEGYSAIVNGLKANNANFHTYQLKAERKFRVVVKNIHHSVDIADLKKELEELGHKVANIYNIKHRVTKTPLSMFWVDLFPDPNFNKRIYDITHLQYTKVVIEAPRQKKEIPQCTKCQRYNHTKAYCFHTPRCVKCGESHATVDCIKTKETQATCALCNGNHPANYKGCTVYQEIKTKRFPPQRPQPIFPQTITPIRRASLTNPNVTFAQAVRQNQTEQQSEPKSIQQDTSNNIEKMMIKLIERMDNMFSLLTAIVNKLVNVSNP